MLRRGVGEGVSRGNSRVDSLGEGDEGETTLRGFGPDRILEKMQADFNAFKTSIKYD